MTPAEAAAFRAAMERDTSLAPPTVPTYAPAPGETRYMSPEQGSADIALPTTGTDNSPLTFGERLEQSGRRLLVPLAQAVDPGLEMRQSAASYGTGLAGAQSGRTGAFQREIEGGIGSQRVQLKPMAQGIDATPTGVPTLNPAYGRIGAPSGGFGSGTSARGGLLAAYRQAETNQLGTLDTQRDLVERGGELKAERIDKMAELAELEAARKHRDAEVLAQHQAKVAEKHEAFLARNQQLADQIGAEKIDATKVLGDMPTGQKAMLVISSLLLGASGHGPEALRRLDDIVSEGVKVQMANADNKKAALSARQNLFSQMMAESGSRDVAETQTRNLIYEAMKQEMGARAERLGIPAVSNDIAIMQNQIEETKQNPLREKLTGEALRAFDQQAAASAAAQRAAEDKAWSRSMDVARLGQEGDKIAIERAKLDAENPAGGGLGKAGTQALALEQAKTSQELAANLRAVAAADPAAVSKGGVLGSQASHLPTWVPGVTGARKDTNAREAYNALVRPGVGAAWKMRTGGVEPKNPGILEEQARAFTVTPSDNEEVVKDRMERFRQHMIESAAAQGAEPPALPSGVVFANKLRGAK